VSIRSEQDRRTGNSQEEFQRDLADNLCYERGTTVESASAQDVYWTLAVTVRDRLAERRVRTARANYVANPKFVYYLSAEYMLGRQLGQNALYTGTADLARQAVAASGFSVEDLESLDVEPGLGNGHPVRVRDFQAGLRGWLSGRAARRLDLLRQPVGVPRSR
jgi:starch phosphorylase